MPKKAKREDELVEAAKAAIDEVFGDTSVSPEETLSRMEELRSCIESSVDALRADLKLDES